MRIEFPGSGKEVGLRKADHVRMTEIAQFKPLVHALLIEPGILDQAMSGGIKIKGGDSGLVKQVIGGADPDQLIGMLKLFASVIADGVDLHEDWAALEEDERIDVLDRGLSPLDLFTMFIQIWMYYSGVSAHIDRKG